MLAIRRRIAPSGRRETAMRGRAAVAFSAFRMLLASVVVVLAALAPPTLAAQERLPEVGSGPPGDVAFRLVGRAEVGPEAVAGFGYLSGVIGLGQGDLVAEAGDAPGSARFTWVVDMPAVDRATQGDVTTFSGEGRLTIHRLPDGGADWADPASFAAGEPVAEYAVALAIAVQRQSPTLGVVVADGALSQQRAESFAIDGADVRFGRNGAGFRLRLTGALAGQAASDQPWPVSLLGTAVLTDPGSAAAGGAGSSPGTAPAAATPAPDVGSAAAGSGTCPEWAGATRDRLLSAQARAEDARAAIEAGGDLAAIDELALAFDADVAAQRSEAPAEADAATQRLASAALGTYLRGLRASADALSVGDAAAVAGAAAILDDADALAARALERLVSAYPACGQP
jgi:hypothetical protein